MKLAYFVHGQGEPTLFLLAYANTAELWIPQVTYFSQKYKVVTVDLRGTGESDKPSCEYTTDLYMDDLESIIEDLQDKNIILVGLFIGGMIAIKYVTKHPGKVAKLVLYSTVPKPLATDEFPYGCFQPNKTKKFSAIAQKSPSKAVKLFWDIAFSGQVGGDYLKELFLKGMQKTPPEIFIDGLRNYAEEDVRPLLTKIKIPTLILRGENDNGCSLDAAKYLKERIPKSKLYTFKDEHHFVNLTAADKFNTVLEKFVTAG